MGADQFRWRVLEPSSSLLIETVRLPHNAIKFSSPCSPQCTGSIFSWETCAGIIGLSKIWTPPLHLIACRGHIPSQAHRTYIRHVCGCTIGHRDRTKCSQPNTPNLLRPKNHSNLRFPIQIYGTQVRTCLWVSSEVDLTRVGEAW